ncbi:MAG: hypothetical protein FWF86_02945 [Clostridia bacterium]|nr:hypothetical protein [Clostridia bacterium]
MNIIRTQAVELSGIPAITYKLKLAAGGAGLKLLRLDSDAAAVFTIDRRTADLLPYGPYDAKLFPEDALREALELTQGLPYTARGKIALKAFSEAVSEPEDVTEEQTDAVDMVGSEEYQAIVSRYSDEKSKLNYTLMNKDFIQFAAKSKVVGEMLAARALEEEILLFIVKSRAAFLAGGKDSLDNAQTAALMETLDEIDPRSAFKELRAWIRRMLAGARG